MCRVCSFVTLLKPVKVVVEQAAVKYGFVKVLAHLQTWFSTPFPFNKVVLYVSAFCTYLCSPTAALMDSVCGLLPDLLMAAYSEEPLDIQVDVLTCY